MEINILLLLVGIITCFLSTILLIVSGFKFLKASVIGMLLSDIVIGLTHHLHIANGIIIPESGDNILYIFWFISLLYLIFFIVIYAYKKRTKNCICSCCARTDYLQIEMEKTFCEKYL